MKIAVLGSSNGAFAAAGDFTLAGHEVRMWRRDEQSVETHRSQGGTITVIDHKGQRGVKMALITADIAKAVSGADLIIAPLPAFVHDDLAAKVAPHLSDGQVVFLPPGTFGTVIFARAAREAGNIADVAYAETGTLPWLARKQGPYAVRISTRAVRLPTGVFPARAADRALAVIGRAFPGAIEPCGDVLSGALMNAGPIIHPPLIVMNAGPIEHFERWDIHKEGTQPAIRRVTDALDRERIALRQAFGYGPPHFPLANHYDKTAELGMYPRDAHDSLTASEDWREHLELTSHRYMIEDARMGLSFLISAADLAVVPVPLAKAFYAIGATIAPPPSPESCRTLDGLGLAPLGRSGLLDFLRQGYRL